jgi:hypothetical protein
MEKKNAPFVVESFDLRRPVPARFTMHFKFHVEPFDGLTRPGICLGATASFLVQVAGQPNGNLTRAVD